MRSPFQPLEQCYSQKPNKTPNSLQFCSLMMAAPPRRSPLSLLLLRCHSFSFLPLLKPTTPTPTTSPSPSHSFSSSSAVPAETPQLPSTKPPPLSARLSFVIDQLESLERSRPQSSQLSARDAALRRIQSWHYSGDQNQHPQHPPPPPPTQTNIHETDKAEETNHHRQDHHAVVVSEEEEDSKMSTGEVLGMEVELVHPWPEWIELMERLAQQKYFDLARVDEDRVAAAVPADLSEVKEEEVAAMDFSRDWITVWNACTNFGRDRFDIIKYVGLIILSSILYLGCLDWVLLKRKLLNSG